MNSQLLHDLREARYESLTLRLWWAALPIALGLIGLLAFVGGVWGLVKALSPQSMQLNSLAFKWLVFGSGVYLFAGTVYELLLRGFELRRHLSQGSQVRPDGALAIYAVVPEPFTLWHLLGWAVVLGLIAVVLRDALTLTPSTTLFVWAGAYAWVILHALNRALEASIQSLPPEISDQKAAAPSEPEAEPTVAEQKPLPFWRILLVKPLLLMLGLILCAVLPVFLLGGFSYYRLGEYVLNFWGIPLAFSELWLGNALLVAFFALIATKGRLYRVLYHTRHASTRWSLLLDFLALTTLFTALFFTLGLCWMLMR